MGSLNGIEKMYAVFGNKVKHGSKGFGGSSCRCCDWVYEWRDLFVETVMKDGAQILGSKIIATRERCSCNFLFCEKCKNCIDHCTCEQGEIHAES